jgi:hypothetical protein
MKEKEGKKQAYAPPAIQVVEVTPQLVCTSIVEPAPKKDEVEDIYYSSQEWTLN